MISLCTIWHNKCSHTINFPSCLFKSQAYNFALRSALVVDVQLELVVWVCLVVRESRRVYQRYVDSDVINARGLVREIASFLITLQDTDTIIFGNVKHLQTYLENKRTFLICILLFKQLKCYDTLISRNWKSNNF